jgi:hypothetical protein
MKIGKEGGASGASKVRRSVILRLSHMTTLAHVTYSTAIHLTRISLWLSQTPEEASENVNL